MIVPSVFFAVMEDVHLQGKQWQIQDLGNEVKSLGCVLLMDLSGFFPSASSQLQLDELCLDTDQYRARQDGIIEITMSVVINRPVLRQLIHRHNKLASNCLFGSWNFV